MLHQNNLCTYYDLNQNPGLAQKINVRADKFEFLEEPSIAQKLIRFADGKQTHINFYLPQMHCSSCLYLLENMHMLLEQCTDTAFKDKMQKAIEAVGVKPKQQMPPGPLLDQ